MQQNRFTPFSDLDIIYRQTNERGLKQLVETNSKPGPSHHRLGMQPESAAQAINLFCDLLVALS